MVFSARALRVLACAIVLIAPLGGCDGFGQPSPASADAPLRRGQADLLLTALEEAPGHGFAPGDFPTAGLEEGLNAGDPAAEQRLRALIVAYASAQHGQDPKPRSLASKWGMQPAAYDAASTFREAVVQDRLKDWLKALPPPFAAYQDLRRAYGDYLKVAAAGGWAPLPAGPPLTLGAQGPRVQALRERLAAEDRAVGEAPPDAPFDMVLAQAVSRFQVHHDLPATGVVTDDTLAALNVPAAARAAQIRANLERWRWVPREQAATRIEVNSAAGVLDLYQDNKPTLHMLVAVGKPGDETPILASAINRIVLNPTWNVPDSIVDEELYPKESRNPGYLARNGFVPGGPENGVKLVQQPGPTNALGRVKFLFDNAYSVYLHDTPSKAAFARLDRSVSHGCVRLQQAIQLAKVLLAAEPGWSPARIDQVLAGQETVETPLSTPVPVQIAYWTATVEDGQVHFRNDVYGWDAALLRRLDAIRSSRA